MNNICIEAPLNKLSFGNVSFAILREFYKNGYHPMIFPIGNQVDIAGQKQDDDFNKWLESCINSSILKYKKDYPSLKLWHINGSMQSISSSKSCLFTFHELDTLTPHEINILKNQDKVFVTSKYTQEVFSQYGVESVFCPLGFDSHNFYQLKNRPKIDGVTSFLMGGKWEPSRKRHAKILHLWVKKYGNNPKYKLNLAITNPFLKAEDLQKMLSQVLEGKDYHNINFIPWTETNAEYNSVLQSSDIVFALAGGEGFDLVAYHATALGALPIGLNAHVYKDYLNDKNSVLINPNSKFPCYDGMFFHPNQPFNQGNFFDWSEDDFGKACEAAETRVKENDLNLEGLKLQKDTYDKTFKIIESSIFSV